MKKKIPFIIMLVMVLSLCFGAVGAFAAAEVNTDVRTISIPTGDRKYMQEEVWARMGNDGDYLKLEFKENARNDSTDIRLLVYDNNEGILKFNVKNFRDATEKSRLRALKTFVTELQSSIVSKQTQQNIMDTMSAMDRDVSLMLIPILMESTTADVYTAMKWLNPILSVVRVIFGIGAILITLLLVGSTIMDMVFIGLPIAREAITNRSEERGKSKPMFVSTDAIFVIQETETSLGSGGTYKNAYLLYFKKRVLTYIIISICLLYLVVGELGGLIAWLLKLGSGVV